MQRQKTEHKTNFAQIVENKLHSVDQFSETFSMNLDGEKSNV